MDDYHLLYFFFQLHFHKFVRPGVMEDKPVRLKPGIKRNRMIKLHDSKENIVSSLLNSDAYKNKLAMPNAQLPFFDVPISPDQAEINFKPHKNEHSFLSALIVSSNNKTKVHIDEAGASGASMVLSSHKKMWKVWKPNTTLANLRRLENEDWKFFQEPGDIVYLPPCHWHYVETTPISENDESPCISIGYTVNDTSPEEYCCGLWECKWHSGKPDSS